MITILIFLSWPLGLIAWLIWRPQEKALPTPDLPPSLEVVPATSNPTTLRVVASEPEARVIQQLLTGSGIACQIVLLASGAAEIQVAQADKEAAEALLEVAPPPISELSLPPGTPAMPDNSSMSSKLSDETKSETPGTKNLLLIVLVIIIVTWLILMAGLGHPGI